MSNERGRHTMDSVTIDDGPGSSVRNHSLFYERDGYKTIVHVMQHDPLEVCPLCERDEFSRRLANVRVKARQASWAHSKNELLAALVQISLDADGVDMKDESFIGPEA